MTGTFTPLPGPPPLARQVRAQARMEARLMLRNGEQLLLAVVIPVIVLIGGVTGSEHLGALPRPRPGRRVHPRRPRPGDHVDRLHLAGDRDRLRAPLRRDQAPRRLAAPRSGLLMGKVGALLLVEALQVVVIGGRPGAGLGPDPGRGGLPARGGDRHGGVRGARAVPRGRPPRRGHPSQQQPVYLLLLAGGAVVLPISAYGAFGDVVRWLPSGALGSAMRAALIDGVTSWRDLLVLCGWAAVGTTLTARTFKWE